MPVVTVRVMCSVYFHAGCINTSYGRAMYAFSMCCCMFMGVGGGGQILYYRECHQSIPLLGGVLKIKQPLGHNKPRL